MSFNIDWMAKIFPSLRNLEQLGSGGQKWVFRCIHPEYGLCVLKLFKPGSEGRIDREIEAVTRLNSQYIPKIFEISVIESPIGQMVCLFEQYIHGDLLSGILDNGPLNQEQILKLAHGLLVAATTAEKANVVHRDIKPDNIIIDTEGHPWLLDFGIARILDLESKTETEARYGPHTLGYASPEQFRNRKTQIDGRTDLFAIGIVLYESATGINPFLENARDRYEIINRLEKLELPPLNLPWDENNRFSDIVSSLTQKFPHRRPHTCAEALNWFIDIS